MSSVIKRITTASVVIATTLAVVVLAAIISQLGVPSIVLYAIVYGIVAALCIFIRTRPRFDAMERKQIDAICDRPYVKSLSVKPPVHYPWWMLSLLALALVSASTIMGNYLRDQQADAHPTTYSGWAILAALILIPFIGPIVEELSIRATIYPYLRSAWGIPGSVTVSTAIFALLHANVVEIGYTIGLGAVLALIYEYSRSLKAVAVVHIIHNSIATFFGGLLNQVHPSSAIAYILPIIIWIGCAIAVFEFATNASEKAIETEHGDA